MPREINNPALILETLDRFLNKPIELVLYGRSAIALGSKPGTRSPDIKFLIEQEPSVIQQLPAAMERAGVPAVAEIQEIFEKVKPKVLRLME